MEAIILDPRLREFAPEYKSEGAAGIDLRACIDYPIHLLPNSAKLVPTGLSIHIADTNYAGLVIPRSGLGIQHGVILGNSVGLIDSDYQGEVMVSLWNRTLIPFKLSPMDRIAQLVIIPVIKAKLDIVESFSLVSQRGKKGIGSTGIK